MRVLTILSGILIAFALVLGTAVWLLLQPGFAVDQAQKLVAERSGHRLTAGTSHVTLLPEPAIVLEDVVVKEPGTQASPLLTARAVTIGTSLGTMLTRDLATETVAIDGAHVNLAIDANGRANWALNDGESASLPNLALRDCSIAFVDERTGLAVRLEGFTGALSVTEDGAAAIEGDYMMAGRRGTLAATIASLKRLSGAGSPASLSITDSAFSFSFDGRLAIARSLNLAGQASLEWQKGVSISGPFETRGKAIVFKQARLDSPAGSGTGDLTADFAGQVPRLTADFELDELDFAAFMPRLAFDGSWSERPLGLSRLKQVDAKGTFAVNALRLGPLDLGRGAISLTATNGRLQISAPEISLHGGKASAGLTIDGTRTVPELALTMQAENLTLPEGRGVIPTAAIALTSEGLSQAELAGRLNGSANFAITGAGWGLLSLEDMLKQAAEGILSDWRAGDSPAAQIDELSASFSIADGIAKSSDLRVSSRGVQVTGTGEIDVLRQALDFKADPIRPDGKPAFPVSLILQGPWSAPRLYPDMPGILEDPAAAYRALSKLHLASETKP